MVCVHICIEIRKLLLLNISIHNYVRIITLCFFWVAKKKLKHKKYIIWCWMCDYVQLALKKKLLRSN